MFAPHPQPTAPTQRGRYPRNAALWHKVPFKQWQWVKLTEDIDKDQFRAGTDVCLLTAGPVNTTPTKRPRQTNEWQKTHADTMYRIAILVEEVTIELVKCQDGPGAILHTHLSANPRGEPSGRAYSPGTAVYLLPEGKTGRDYYVQYPQRSSGTPLKIPDDACGVVRNITTFSAGTKGMSGKSTIVNFKRLPYVVAFPVRRSVWRWEECNWSVNSAYFKALSESDNKKCEKLAENVHAPPPPAVVKLPRERVLALPILPDPQQ